ncbi:MAG: hypothetical protein WCH21_03365, partial [Bacteroidota bacterium]
GRVVLSGVQTPTDIYAFFQSEYPRAGWTTISAVKSKTSILVFTKGEDKIINGKTFHFENRLMLVKPVIIVN